MRAFLFTIPALFLTNFLSAAHDSDAFTNPASGSFSSEEHAFESLESISAETPSIGTIQGAVEREDSLTHLDAEPSAIVDSVNVITGEFVDSQTDLTIPAAEPLILQRFYCSSEQSVGSLCNGWNLNHFGQIQRGKEYTSQGSFKKYLATVLEAGSLYHYEAKKKYNYHMTSKSYEKGVTNSSQGIISGRHNLKNNHLNYDRDEKVCCLRKGSGSELIFERRSKSSDFWDLIAEKKPNGNQIAYHYDSKDRLDSIKTLNRDGKVLSQIALAFGKDPKKRHVMQVFKDKVAIASYVFEEFKSKGGGKGYFLSQARCQRHPEETYEYESKDEGAPARVVRKNSPEGRFHTTEYYRKGQNHLAGIDIKIDSSKDPRMHRVMIRRAPIGPDATPLITHKYVYQLNTKKHEGINHDWYEVFNGFTKVYDAENHLTKYWFNNDHRLTAVEKFTGAGTNNTLYSTERLFWGDNSSPDCTNLISRSIETKQGWKQFIRSFVYDSRGNIIKDTLTGNLSGKNTEAPITNSEGRPIANGCESHYKTFSYSTDGKNLLVSTGEGANEEYYSYVPGTDLLSSKFYQLGCWVYKREFYEYDENAVLIKEIHDDGGSKDPNNLTGVTERHIKYIKPRTTEPIGLPEVIEEKYLDLASGEEKLLKKSVNSYTKEGYTSRQETYDSDGAYSHCHSWEYDSMGNVIKEVDALGNATTRKYDANGNLIYEQGPNPNYHLEFVYDFSNRLLKREEVYANGTRLTNTYRYDLLNKVAGTDIYGNETKYSYDEFSRLIKTILPKVEDENGDWNNQPDPLFVTKQYDVLNRPTTTTDAKGAVTATSYTIRNKPYHIVYPDGSQERFEYNLKGTLRKSVARNGTYTLYTYDHLDNPIKKEVFSPAGELLYRTSAHFNAYHMLSETDAMGNVKLYRYDDAGRLSETLNGSSRSTVAYDKLGRPWKTCDYFGPNETDYIAKIKSFDLLNRVVEERVEDAQGNVFSRNEYRYDAEGHRIEAAAYLQAGKAVTKSAYNSHHQPCEVIDAEGNLTRTVYKYDYRNEHGQVVPCNETYDALGNITVSIQDAQGRVVSVIHKNTLGQITQKKQYFYDANGNRARLVETVFTPGSSDRQVITAWSYDNCNRLTSTIEAVGTPEQKQTSILYNAYGQKECVIKPDGVSLWHEYDWLGRLTTLRSSDSTIHYCYTYDLNGNVTRVDDRVNNLATLKEYDANNRLIKETQANNLAVSYSYDDLSRPLAIALPDGSSVEYAYQGDKMKEVRRLSENGQQLYVHTYTAYDAGGKLAEAQLVLNAGKANYAYDILGRPVSIEFGQWSESIQAYDKAGNIMQRQITDSIGAFGSAYAYDDLYQLISEKGYADHSYVCDSLYNRVLKDGLDNSINALNQLLDDGVKQYAYDGNGNLIRMIQDGATASTYVYDALDRLICFTQGVQQVRYTYDEQNRRLSKAISNWDSEAQGWSAASAVNYLYVGQNEVGAQDASNNLIEFRALGIGKGAEIGAAVAVELNGLVYAPLHDHNGNVAALVDADSGEVVESYRYTAFGEERVFDANGEELQSPANPWRFSSKRVDLESGLVYFGRRYYNPVTSRWLTPDPIAQEGGPNLYAYVLNSPLTHFDLYGLVGISDSSVVNSQGSGWMDTFSRGMSYIGSLMRAPGRFIEYIGRNWVPIPLARDLIELTGRVLAGRGIQDYVPSFRKHSEFLVTEGPNPNPSVRYVMVNGVGVSRKEFIKRMWDMSRELGVPVYGIYNSSHGMVYDVIEWAMQRLGMPTNSEKVMQGAMNYLVKDVGGVDVDANIWINAHSQGGEITQTLTKSLTAEERHKLVSVFTYGTANIIDGKAFKHVTNFISYGDPISLICNPVSWTGALIKPRSNVQFLKSQGIPIIEHNYDGPTYQTAVNKVAVDFRHIFGVH